jgi:hypothetical protein
LLHSVRNDGERSVREDECIPRTPIQLSLRGAQRRGNPPPNCLCEKRSDVAIYRYRLDCFTPFAMTGKRAYEKRSNVAILHPTVFARSAATWQSSTQLSLRGAQRRGNLSVSLGLLHSVRNDGEKERARRRVHTPNPHPTVFARSSATWQSSTQLSLRGAQRRGNLSVSLAEMISLWQCGFFTKEPQRNEATLCLYII